MLTSHGLFTSGNAMQYTKKYNTTIVEYNQNGIQYIFSV